MTWVGADLTAVPAYGRDYHSKAEVLEAWNAGKDFQLQPSGSYINQDDKPDDVTLRIRFRKLTQVLIID
jgi:hypothetical protein